MVEEIRSAHGAGLDSLFIGDHHVNATPYYQNVPMLGRLLAEWPDRDAGALFQLPLWDPVLLAEQVGTLAALTTGRFVLVAAIGGASAQFDGMGRSMRARPRAFESCLSVVRALLAGGLVDSDGAPALRGARICPCPSEPVEVWIAASAAPAIDRAARMADGWLGRPDISREEAVSQAKVYADGCERHGRQVGTIALRRDVHLATTMESAIQQAQPYLSRYTAAPDAPIVGTPEHAAEVMSRLAGDGFSPILLRHFVDDHALVLQSYDRLAELCGLVQSV
jgi:alkanesulfonate monooxygenase SsuD/methylene tetrahydromethanopterin reductase-like flavin-dependent oxidoreductase (luciferase family)